MIHLFKVKSPRGDWYTVIQDNVETLLNLGFVYEAACESGDDVTTHYYMPIGEK